MHAKEIIGRYSAEPAVFRHRALLISVNRSATERTLYDATRYAWKISRRKAQQAEVILANRQGLIVSAFVADAWLDATGVNFPGFGDAPGRLALSAARHQTQSADCMSARACRTNFGNAALRIRTSIRLKSEHDQRSPYREDRAIAIVSAPQPIA
jgi:hypothetical protein